MLFNSIHFALFFVVVTTTYFLLPHKYRWMLLSVNCFSFRNKSPIYLMLNASSPNTPGAN
jgi:alginate O-acetyltransferase complex protein AlgI